ncbi:MAG TPA: hypothetical protein VGM23_06170 [Armatimonadota bacterium]|jgi:hypothetical protein
MARAKVTSTDIYARVARGECANYRNNACQGRTPCTVLVGENCEYFAKYVKPLLDYPEFNAKYAKEAKVTLLLNPKAKVVRQRRKAEEPALDLQPTAAQKTATPQPEKTPAVPARAGKKSSAPATALPLPVASAPAAKSATRGKTAISPAGKPNKAVVEKTPAKAGSRTTAVAVKKTEAKPVPSTKASRVVKTAAGKVETGKKVTTTVTVQGKVVTSAAKSTTPTRKTAASTPVASPVQPAPAKTRVKKAMEEIPITTTVTVGGDVLVRPAAQRPAKRLKTAVPAGAAHSAASITPTLSEKPKVEKTQLTLDMFASAPVQRTVSKRR